MDRRYYRKYENYDTVVPRPEDFPILNMDNKSRVRNTDSEITKVTESTFKTDDLVLMVVLLLLLMEEEKDMVTILSIAALLFMGYIF